jgi:hypothetical protein
MIIENFSIIIKEEVKLLSLNKVWSIRNFELSPTGAETLNLLKSNKIISKILYKKVTWTGQSILEFQDLQDIKIPSKGQFLNINYLYFEGISALRESIIAGLNGLYHSAFSMLRVALETSLYHYWWKKYLLKQETFQEYYNWLLGKCGCPPFSNIISDIYKWVDMPHSAFAEKKLRKLYRVLCAYAHKPLLSESLTILKDGNIPGTSIQLIQYWLDLLNKVQRCILDISIGYNPQVLFPVDINRKFGFNPPVGIFFDEYNFIPLKIALGKKHIKEYQNYFRNNKDIVKLMEWFNSMKDLSDEEILLQYKGKNIKDKNLNNKEKILLGWIEEKAKLRVLSMAFAYNLINHAIDTNKSNNKNKYVIYN